MGRKIYMELSASRQREIARKMLRGQWRTAVMGTLIYMLAVSIPPLILELLFFENATLSMSVSLIYMLITIGPFTLGYSMFMLQIFRGKGAAVGEIFSGFSILPKALGMFVFLMLIIWLFALPSAIVLTSTLIQGGAISFIGTVIAIGLLYFPIAAALNYSQVFFITADYHDIGIMAAFRVSKELMLGNRWKLVCLNLSFMGWSILVNIPTVMMNHFIGSASELTVYFAYSVLGLILSAGYLVLTPYLTATTAGFYEVITGHVTIKEVPVDALSEEFRKNAEIEGSSIDALSSGPKIEVETKAEAEIETKAEVGSEIEDKSKPKPVEVLNDELVDDKGQDKQ